MYITAFHFRLRAWHVFLKSDLCLSITLDSGRGNRKRRFLLTIYSKQNTYKSALISYCAWRGSNKEIWNRLLNQYFRYKSGRQPRPATVGSIAKINMRNRSRWMRNRSRKRVGPITNVIEIKILSKIIADFKFKNVSFWNPNLVSWNPWDAKKKFEKRTKYYHRVSLLLRNQITNHITITHIQ